MAYARGMVKAFVMKINDHVRSSYRKFSRLPFSMVIAPKPTWKVTALIEDWSTRKKRAAGQKLASGMRFRVSKKWWTFFVIKRPAWKIYDENYENLWPSLSVWQDVRKSLRRNALFIAANYKSFILGWFIEETKNGWWWLSPCAFLHIVINSHTVTNTPSTLEYMNSRK